MSFSSVRPNFTSLRIRYNSLARNGPARPTRRGISDRSRSRASPCGTAFITSETRMMAVAPPALALGVVGGVGGGFSPAAAFSAETAAGARAPGTGVDCGGSVEGRIGGWVFIPPGGIVGGRTVPEVVVADLDQIAFLDAGGRGDLLAVDADAVVRTQVLDQDVPVLLHQPRVTARDVALGQADGVAFLTSDGDLVANQRDDGLATLVVLDDELHLVSFLGSGRGPAALAPSWPS